MTHPVTRGNFGEAITGTNATFFVTGKPVPQGSLKFIHGKAIHVRAQDLAVWRANIAISAKNAFVEKANEGVEIHLRFITLKPKTVTRNEPFIRPDLDKLIRAVMDGLTGVAYDDDQQVTRLSASKEYGITEGVWITIIDRQKLRRSNLSGSRDSDTVFINYDVNTYTD